MTNDPANNDFRRFSGALINFTDQALFDTTGSIVLDVAFSTTTGVVTGYNIDVVDINGNKVTVVATQTSGKILITKQSLIDARVPGFDTAQIKAGL